MLRRVLGWLRTLGKLALLVLGYFWVGAAYKVVYAQTHDVTRFKGRIQIPYYQQQFLLDALLYQTWMFGPDFRNYIGELPSLGTLVSTNTQAALADYCRAREVQLNGVADRYPYSLFAEEALDDAYLYSMGASFLGLVGSRERPAQVYAAPQGKHWSVAGVPNSERSVRLSRRLADTFPDSPQASAALFRVAEAEAQAGRKAESLALYRRVLAEYPHSEQAEASANALARAARATGRLEQARNYQRLAMRAAERTARERYPGKALPPRATLSVLGFRLELSSLELQLNRVVPARELATVADRETARVGSVRSLEESLKSDLKDRRERLQELRNELWVADLFDAVKVPLPGPAPRAREFPVSGRVLLEGQPFEGVEVVLAGGQGGEAPRLSSRRAPSAPGTYRARTDRHGRYTITGVPAGAYVVATLFPAQVPDGRIIQPEGVAPLPESDFPQPAVVDDAPLSLPDLRFRRALPTRTFGEVPPAGPNIRLEWEPWPLAARYVVKVFPSGGLRGMFDKRVPEEKREEFRQDPVLWSQSDLRETHADCPLRPIAPDIPPQVLAVQYEYQVAAYDAAGVALATSSRPLCRFYLSSAAREAMLKQKPPVRGGGRRRRNLNQPRPNR